MEDTSMPDPIAPPERWHVRSSSEVAASLGTDALAGLTADEAAARLAATGPNLLTPPTRTPAWKQFIGQFNDLMIWVLLAAVVVSALDGELVDAVAITAILLLNGVLGVLQEYRAERAMEALEEMAAPVAAVIRGGVETEVAASQLVPGDVVLLESGDKVPADGRLLEAAALRVEEASLTGESLPSSKTSEALVEEELPLGDRTNMLFAVTAVAVGRARFVVTETGQSTEMGRIADLLGEQRDEPTPLQKELKSVGKIIAFGVLAIAALVFAVDAWQAWGSTGHLTLSAALAYPPFREKLTVSLLIAISLAVAAIPEGLPAIVTVALSLGVRKMAQRNAIVRRLHAVETLGSTTFICTDKTGTLTRNEMTVRRLVVGEDESAVGPDWTLEPGGPAPQPEDLERLLRAAASCNDARFTADGVLVGDPTETALIVAADRLSEDRVRPRRVGEVPFDSARKRMTTVHALDGGRVAYTKGAADIVLHLCSSARLRGTTVPMTEKLLQSLLVTNEALAAGGYRTLAMASRDLEPGEPDEGKELEHAMTYLGIIALVDPPRAEVPEAIAQCHRAGISVAMVTGDHALTALAIAREIGLVTDPAHERVVTGVELEHMTDEELETAVDEIRIYARVDPEHKLRIVAALKRRGHVVAMTGDGVNDAPALKRADIGVAMGRVGTDVAREAADVVLADDDFATIVEAIRQGRAVFDNLRKFILFLLSCNISEVSIVFATSLFSATPALLPLQLLWINLVTDGLPALALGVDPASRGIMDRPPRGAADSVLTTRRRVQVVWQGVAITLAGLSMYIWTSTFMPGHDPARAQTMLFTAMVLAQLLHAFDFRSETSTVFSPNSLRIPWLIAALLGSMSLHLLVIYVPALQRVFSTHPLSVVDWGWVVVSALVPVVVIDIATVATARFGRTA